MCHRGLKSSKRIWKYTPTMPLVAYISLTRNKRHGHCIFPSRITIARQIEVSLSTTVQHYMERSKCLYM